ncbi:MAG: M3 family oligoendopeptidase [Candidatus Eisenbacteria bacterium]|nr:M3 family oligoendopeptidase [Candidatus Eisenbacteria bacterium]
MPKNERLPHWDLASVYRSLESDDFESDFELFKKQLGELDEMIEEHHIGELERPPDDTEHAGDVLDAFITKLNETLRLRATLEAYIYGFVTTDSYNKTAARRMSELEKVSIRARKILVRFEAWVGSLESSLDEIAEKAPVTKEHRVALADIAEESRFRMETPLEDLASELVVSGGGAMWKLQGTVTSQLKMPFEKPGGETEELPITVIRNMSNSPDESVRRRAYETELAGYERVREPVAFALNCVKGTAITLAKRRGHESVLDKTLQQNRMDRETLDALLASMRDSFGDFRRYFRSKAKKLGKEKLAWWDLTAPTGSAELSYSWDEARDFIVSQFGTFTGELADFAKNAFEQHWIDAEPRDGKTGGAYCMRVPKVDESRILANFDGSFDQVSTLAHELGHGFHNHCQVGLPRLRSGSPMPLAETASIFCETIVTNAALAAATKEEKLGILENQLVNGSQVIVDIYSRFLFESEVIRRRDEAELSADDFCEIMLDAQRQTYGDGLDQEHLNSYMWLWKPHYYSHELSFYNFPYAFGLLFGLGVYAIYEEKGDEFIPRYKELLRSTGEGKIPEIASEYGIDVRSKSFWDASLDVLRTQIDLYCGMDG